jgi:hypothetical protein
MESVTLKGRLYKQIPSLGKSKGRHYARTCMTTEKIIFELEYRVNVAKCPVVL